MAVEVWFWQAMLSHQILGLADSLAARGVRVRYIAAGEVVASRRALGWAEQPEDTDIEILLLNTTQAVEMALDGASGETQHIVEGIRGSKFVREILNSMERRDMKYWIMMELGEQEGVLGVARRVLYRYEFKRRRRHMNGILAIGHRAVDWIVARGIDSRMIYPFAYFMKSKERAEIRTQDRRSRLFRILYVGQFVRRKGIAPFFRALSKVEADFELWMAGGGTLEDQLKNLGDEILINKIRWLGVVDAKKIHELMLEVDCLVLPSMHDGWGTVVSEALMAGARVICSDECGSAGVVRASGDGWVFKFGDDAELTRLLTMAIKQGPLSNLQRQEIACRGEMLGSDQGANYLLKILRGERPVPPWQRS